jgi:mRNA-degrading endonuclease toxin of MazEF toxin-antitoxin module
LAESRPIRQGNVYWVDDFPPSHGDTAKRRPVVVVSSSSMLRSGGHVLVVACTSSALPSDTEAIELPNTARTPQARSGLNRRTWAVPSWWLPAPRERLTDYAGFIRGDVLRRVVAAAARHIAELTQDDSAPLRG